MGLFDIFMLAVAVATDAFAVSICKGTTIRENLKKKAITVASWFGVFQGIMPLIGFFLMDSVEKYLSGIKAYVIFGLLAYIGISMIVNSLKNEKIDSSLKFKEMLVLSLATSLDALSIGMTVSLLSVNVYLAVSIITLITFMFCFFGVIIGSKFGEKYKNKAEIIGGIILIILGLKVLIGYLL